MKTKKKLKPKRIRKVLVIRRCGYHKSAPKLRDLSKKNIRKKSTTRRRKRGRKVRVSIDSVVKNIQKQLYK